MAQSDSAPLASTRLLAMRSARPVQTPQRESAAEQQNGPPVDAGGLPPPDGEAAVGPVHREHEQSVAAASAATGSVTRAVTHSVTADSERGRAGKETHGAPYNVEPLLGWGQGGNDGWPGDRRGQREGSLILVRVLLRRPGRRQHVRDRWAPGFYRLHSRPKRVPSGSERRHGSTYRPPRASRCNSLWTSASSCRTPPGSDRSGARDDNAGSRRPVVPRLGAPWRDDAARPRCPDPV